MPVIKIMMKSQTAAVMFFIISNCFAETHGLAVIRGKIIKNNNAFLTATGCFEQKIHAEPHHQYAQAKFFYRNPGAVRIEYSKPAALKGIILIQLADIDYRYGPKTKKWYSSNDPGGKLHIDLGMSFLDEDWESVTAEGNDTVNGAGCLLVRAIKKTDAGTDILARYWFNNETGMIMKTETYDKDMRKVFESEISYKKTNSVWFPVKVKNYFSGIEGKGYVAIDLSYKKVKINSELDAGLFVCPAVLEKSGGSE